ncbi:hypothetical protein EAH89_14385 [Roseomonas nepalensis]|uniref:Uncharacterized protein n=1 Tax=Muricoccus nepalensis TaxID=1854500 RepID=A0A502G416_9PROT|nr:hypothetical protein [Roseomonas nepalensis]TPG55743.1 hypothetical protein EAH89_14385 [Roseomonas nepalensis]
MPKGTDKGRETGPVGLTPFADEAASTSVGDLTIENRLDRVSVYGSLDLTRDRRGLEAARRLRSLLDAVVGALESEGDRLPEELESKPGTTQVPNPFG